MLLSLLLIESIEDHLRDRGIDPNRTGLILDKKNGIATFLLYNLSGQLVGYQTYNPKGSKKSKSNDPLLAKYFTWVTKEAPPSKITKIAVWGTETIKTGGILFVTEGIFDAVKIHKAGYPAIAALANNPKQLKPWLKALSVKVIVIADNDAAGRKLAKIGHKAYTTPEPYKDLGDMPQAEVNKFLKKIAK